LKKRCYKKEKWLRKNYREKGLSALEIARNCGVQKSTIYYWLEKNRIPIRTSLESRRGMKRRKRKKKLITFYRLRFWLYDMYVTKDMTMAEIAEMCNCSESAIRTWLIRHAIKIRPQKRRGRFEGVSDAWYRGKAREAFEKYWDEEPPKGYLIHHVDRDLTNWDITNLALVTRAFHNTIHKKGMKRKAREIQAVEIPKHMQELPHLAA